MGYAVLGVLSLASVASLASLGATTDALPMATWDGTCPGCVAAEWNDDATGMVKGVQVVFQAPGVTIGGELGIKNGKCEWQLASDGATKCLPAPNDSNCNFTGAYTVSSSAAGQFRDDNGWFCNWSRAQPGGLHYMSESIAWIAACDNGLTIRNVRFFANAVNCQTGGNRIAELQFGGTCGKCQEGAPPFPQ